MEPILSLNSKVWKTLKSCLYPFSWIYGLIVFIRNLAYDLGWISAKRLDLPVISIGNLSAGGSGKTPVTMALAKILKGPLFRLKPAILSRGYKRKSQGYRLVSAGKGPICSWLEAGDEPYLLASNLHGVFVAVDKERYHGGVELIHRAHPDLILLDDAFQHRRLHRDLDIVLLDAERDLQGKLLPVGLLRESHASLRRAGLIILTHFDPGDPVHEKIWAVCAKTLKEERLVACRTRPTNCRDLRTGKAVPLDQIQGMRLLPFCGLAKPESFLHTLEAAGAEFPYLVRFPDHHQYGPKDVERLSNAYAKSRASYLMTTEKDAVKLEGLFLALPILVLEVEIEWLRGKENLEGELFKLFT